LWLRRCAVGGVGRLLCHSGLHERRLQGQGDAALLESSWRRRPDQRAALAALRDHLLLGTRCEEEVLALALSRSCDWNHRLGAVVDGAARLPPLLQQPFSYLRIAWRGHHSAHLVLPQRSDAAARR